SHFGALSGKKRFSRFLHSRSSVLKDLQIQQKRVFRRLATALLSLDFHEKNQFRIVSQFVAEDCQNIISQYRTLIAEACMSCVELSAGRENFLKSFGYLVSFPPTIPYLPLVIAFGLDFAVLLWPLLAAPWIAPYLPIKIFPTLPFPPRNIIIFSLAD